MIHPHAFKHQVSTKQSPSWDVRKEFFQQKSHSANPLNSLYMYMHYSSGGLQGTPPPTPTPLGIDLVLGRKYQRAYRNQYVLEVLMIARTNGTQPRDKIRSTVLSPQLPIQEQICCWLELIIKLKVTLKVQLNKKSFLPTTSSSQG